MVKLSPQLADATVHYLGWRGDMSLDRIVHDERCCSLGYS